MALPKSSRLSKSEDIKIVLRSPYFVESRFFRLVFRKNFLPRARFVILLSKKVSKSAVKRNLFKRRSSEWIRKFFLLGAPEADYALIFKSEASRLDVKKFYKELGLIFSQIKI